MGLNAQLARSNKKHADEIYFPCRISLILWFDIGRVHLNAWHTGGASEASGAQPCSGGCTATCTIEFPPDWVNHRQVKYLNNAVEADHGKLKRLIKPTLGFQSMKTAYVTIKGLKSCICLRRGNSGFGNTAQAREIETVLVTELSRWGRSTIDLLNTLRDLNSWKVSVIAMSGMTFDLPTPHGRMMATFLSGIAEFERDLISERVKSGLAAAKARGKKLGRQKGQRPKSDKLATEVISLIEEGRSYRWIARDLGISKNTVMDIVKRARDAA